MATWITINDEIDDIYNDWDNPATPIALPNPNPDENGWLWYPDSNGNLFSLYFDPDGNECMVWQQDAVGSFYWRCAGVGYNCRDIGINGRRGIYFQDIFVGTMILDNQLSVTWLPETYINQDIVTIDNIYDNINDNIYDNNNHNINLINDNINLINDDIYDIDESDDNNDP